jgi:hypothetical protein
MTAAPAPRILSSYASSVAKRLTVAPMILEDLFSWKVCTCIACFSSKIFYGMRLMGELLAFAQLGESPVKELAVSVNHAVTVPPGGCVFLYAFGAHSRMPVMRGRCVSGMYAGIGADRRLCERVVYCDRADAGDMSGHWVRELSRDRADLGADGHRRDSERPHGKS